MIFVTIGFQLPFDRLINAVDNIAPIFEGVSIIAQVSKTNYKVANMKALDFIPPAQFNAYFSNAEVIISHAGMGTIISALEQEIPIIVMPRLRKYGEVTTDHQLATVKYFEKHNYIHVAYDEDELKNKLTGVLKGNLKAFPKINKYASSELISSIKTFICE